MPRGITSTLLICGLLLAACEGRKPATAEAPKPTAAPAATATPSTPRRPDVPTGVFAYHADGGEAELTIATAEAGQYKVSIDAGSAGCNGQVTGTAARRAEALEFVSAPPEDDTPTCRANITFSGGKPRVEEIDGCTYYHGASCAFSSYP